MLCSKELIRSYLERTNRDLITRVIAGEDIAGINYKRCTRGSHKYVTFSYNYNARSYVIDISCNILVGYFTTVDNMVYTKQDVYETIFSYDKSYVSVFAKEFIMLKLSDNTVDIIGIASVNDIDNSDDIYKFVNVIRMINLKVKFGKFDFSQLWEMERSQLAIEGADSPGVWYDHEIDVVAPLRLDLVGEISPRIRTCKYPLIINGCRISNKLNYPYDEVMWALKCIYSGVLITTALSQTRIELLREMGIDVDGIIASCICFISNESQLYFVEFC
ncbi:hypothetical protein F-S17_0458 [Faustovirus]|nr:hypothetical protein F-LCD7_0462 [Faustovirus]QJX72724.1 hypothetical protein F-S17_0458 [Faustovirus]QJX74234.1 hypothetical protein F-E9_481 [Faustovirus]SMH63445.1 Hypothetical protein FSTVLC9_410 [Faustovirus]